MYRLLKLLFIVLACSALQALGGTIVNGREVLPKSLQYMASVQHNQGHVCGGFLIKKDIVLTAAHCDRKAYPIETVVLGTNDLSRVDKKSMTYHVTKCKHHDFSDVVYGNDIMILKLSRPTTIHPIRLPKKRTSIKDNAACFVAGWGATGRRFQTNKRKLREVDVSTINRKTCEKAWRTKLPANIICAGGYRTKKGFCQGDSGGPLECNKMAVGIVSFNNHTCVYPDIPNVYTDIIKFLPWINNPKRKCLKD